MEGREVFKHAVGMITDVVEATFAQAGISADDIDWFVPHQANKRIIDASAKKLGIADEKVVITVDLHGNTSAASVPLALAVASRTAASSRATSCCSRRWAAASPGARCWCAGSMISHSNWSGWSLTLPVQFPNVRACFQTSYFQMVGGRMGEKHLRAPTWPKPFTARWACREPNRPNLVETVLDEICEAIVRGETVKLSSFATFHVRGKNERIGRNPKTGEEVPILPRRVMTFKASNVLKNRILRAHQAASQGRQVGPLPSGFAGRSSG